MWHGVPFARQQRPIIGVLGLCWLLWLLWGCKQPPPPPPVYTAPFGITFVLFFVGWFVAMCVCGRGGGWGGLVRCIRSRRKPPALHCNDGLFRTEYGPENQFYFAPFCC